MAVTCVSCGFTNPNEDLLFCLECGALGGGGEYQNSQSLKAVQAKIQTFLKESQKAKVGVRVRAPLEDLQGMFEEAVQTRNFLQVLKGYMGGNATHIQGFIEQLEKFLQRDAEFQIAFVGTIKAGKSTLINAMLQKDYASVDVNPETAVLTKFKYGANPLATISFYTAKEWAQILGSAKHSAGNFFKEYEKSQAEQEKSQWLNKPSISEPLSKECLAKYTSSRSSAHYFVKEVSIQFPEFPYEKNIVFVDTPGLNDAIAYRSNVTRNYIQRANVVLMCVECKNLQGVELDTIFRIFDNTYGHPEKVYTLGTHYDILNNPKKDWEKIKGKWMEYLSLDHGGRGKTGYSSKLAQQNIIHVSGHLSLLCSLFEQKTLGAEEERQLKRLCYGFFEDDKIATHLKELQKISNVEAIHQRIKEDILNSVQQEIIKDATRNYALIQQEIKDYFEHNAQSLHEDYTSARGDTAKISAKIEQDRQKLESLKNSKLEFEDLIAGFNQESKSVLDDLDAQIEKIIQESGV
ncbi:dynamin family protein [Helicobacter cynogastricus]|uniref:dynamin family protein n=1 Tax=Helicobacter cynogastricus TaxID=329937 RepID=UPI000CF0E8F5|nr:dynamin family protein [Helicobacter cynogastricus]